jgi:glycosyltransferase involved in cell wall biosynthesis
MKVSIITVTFNCVSVINDCLNSISSQEYNNIQHIVIDGASTDGTLSILESKHSQISTLISKPDNGIYDAMNKGIRIATGDIIGFLNSDDFYANNKVISKVVREFERDSLLDACYSDLIYVDQLKISKIVRYVKSSEFNIGLFSKGWCPPHPTFFVRRSVYERLGIFDLNYHIASDVDLMMRFLEKHKIKSKYIPEVWVKMRMGGTTNKNLKNIWLQNKEIIHSFNKNNLSVNLLKFLVFKIISRILQFFKRSSQ